ncbi:MAG TPA: hypothetical protein VGK81_10815 [Anaerolineae bacterium]
MHIIHGPLHLLWHIVTLPFHILASIIKIVILGPIVMILTLVVLVVGCLALFAPWTLSLIHIPSPDVGGWLISQVSQIGQPSSSSTSQTETGPLQVTSSVRDKTIVVSWSIKQEDALWYQVLRKTVTDTTWRRIAIVPASGAANGQYEYVDAAVLHGLTYLYAITEVGPAGGESTPVPSVFQVVAP